MKKLLTLVLIPALVVVMCSCAKVYDDVTAPAEPAEPNTSEERAEPKDAPYNPEIEEEIESMENPLETEEMEQQPLIK